MTDLQNFVHRGGVLFADGLGNIKNTRTGHFHRLISERDLYDIADLHIIRRAGYFAVYRDVLCVADLVCDGAALYQARHLKILIKSHNIQRQKPHPFRTLER